jgi:TatD DNase family protein
MHLIDSHCHLDVKQFDSNRDDILSHCQLMGIKTIIVPAITAKNWANLLIVCQSSNMLFPALGLHPMFMAEHKSEHITLLEELINSHHPIAIGEIGLDFYLKTHDKTSQIELFTKQLKLAQQANLPVLLHVRKAHDQVVKLLKQIPVIGGIVHAFNGSFQQAEHYQKLNFLLGVGGAITHPRATRLRSVINELPLTSLVLETDAPDMPLYQQQNMDNRPENIFTILDSLTELRAESRQTIASVTANNCQRLLNFH